MSRKIAVIVASGTGSRMGSEIPKQFLPLQGKPVLVHTLEKFLSIHDCEVILALSQQGLSFWEPIAARYFSDCTIPVVLGGDTRFQSVKNVLDTLVLDDTTLVAIHDGVRPLIHLNTILNSFLIAERFGAAVTCVDSKDSVRLVEGESNRALERKYVKLIQTPQTFQGRILKVAYGSAYQERFTDDASVVEAAGYPVHLVEGSYANFKITTPEDLALAEHLLHGSPH
jgi:2-C-methyl-D-erythritol 4-phosphate cytidylyltransferase